MTHCLPPNLLSMFQARPPVKHVEAVNQRPSVPLHGLSGFIDQFTPDPPTKPLDSIFTSVAEVKKRKREQKQAEYERVLKKRIEDWDPQKRENITEDAYKTLFVARIAYSTTEDQLRQELEVYGPIKAIFMVRDKFTNKFRGQAFVEFERERDMKTAYKQADGKKINGKRILVDVERGRTVKNWVPRKLGGGLGATRLGSDRVNQKYSGREPPRDGGRDRPSSRRPSGSYGGRYPDGERGRRDDRRRDSRDSGHRNGGSRHRDRDDRDRYHDNDRDRHHRRR